MVDEINRDLYCVGLFIKFAYKYRHRLNLHIREIKCKFQILLTHSQH